jgi:hypothetical protein
MFIPSGVLMAHFPPEVILVGGMIALLGVPVPVLGTLHALIP